MPGPRRQCLHVPHRLPHTCRGLILIFSKQHVKHASSVIPCSRSAHAQLQTLLWLCPFSQGPCLRATAPMPCDYSPTVHTLPEPAFPCTKSTRQRGHDRQNRQSRSRTKVRLHSRLAACACPTFSAIPHPACAPRALLQHVGCTALPGLPPLTGSRPPGCTAPAGPAGTRPCPAPPAPPWSRCPASAAAPPPRRGRPAPAWQPGWWPGRGPAP